MMIQGKVAKKAEESAQISIIIYDDLGSVNIDDDDDQVDGGWLALEVTEKVEYKNEVGEAMSLLRGELLRADDEAMEEDGYGGVEVDNLAEGVWNCYFGMYSKWYHF